MEKLHDGCASAAADAAAAAARPRAAVCMWGLLRSVEWTWDSLRTNVIESVEEMGFTPVIFIHTYSSHRPYTNEWASESSDRLLDPRLLGLIPYHTAVLEDKEAAVSKLGELMKLLKTKSPWFGSSPECAAENYVLALHSLDRVTRLTADAGHDYSVFIFVRPDTLILQPLDLGPALFSGSPCLFLPEHARAGNYDDRFCVCSPAKASVYGSRIHVLPDLLGNPNPMQRGNSEALLFQLLQGHAVHQVPFPLRRIRIGGRMADRETGTLRVDVPRLFERVYGARGKGPAPHPDCLDLAWASRTPDVYGFPVEGRLPKESFPFSPAATAPFVLSIGPAHTPTQPSAPVEHLEIQASPSRVVVVSCSQSHGSPRLGFWACGSLEVALLEMGVSVKNLRHSDPRLHSIQQRFVDFAWRFDFARSMAAVSNLVSSLQCRTFACVGIPDVRKVLVTVTNPNTIDACVMMALIHGLALGRVYRPRADESTCQPRCVIHGGTAPASSMLLMREHTQSAYEIGMSLKRAEEDGPPSPCCVLFVGSMAEELPKCGDARLVIVAGSARRLAGALGFPIFKGDDADIYSISPKFIIPAAKS